MSESITMLWCDQCDSYFDEVGGPVYECSRCGKSYVEERRCETDNIFMAKVAGSSCPECEAPFESDPESVEVYEASDGSYHQSQDEVEKWDADAPAREQRAIESKKRTDVLLERMRQKGIEEGVKLLPIFQELKAKLPEGCVKIEARLDHELEELIRELASVKRDPDKGYVFSKYLMIEVEELILLLFPDYETAVKIEKANDYLSGLSGDWSERLEISRSLKARAMETLEEMFGEGHGWDHGVMDLGSAFLSEAKVAAPMLLKVIERSVELENQEKVRW